MTSSTGWGSVVHTRPVCVNANGSTPDDGRKRSTPFRLSSSPCSCVRFAAPCMTSKARYLGHACKKSAPSFSSSNLPRSSGTSAAISSGSKDLYGQQMQWRVHGATTDCSTARTTRSSGRRAPVHNHLDHTSDTGSARQLDSARQHRVRVTWHAQLSTMAELTVLAGAASAFAGWSPSGPSG